jgi:guanylate kinase
VGHLLEKFPFLEFSISATSRAPRGSEQNGKEYYFITADEFRRRIDAGELVEYQEVYPGSFYGTLKSEVERIWAKGHIILFDIDVKGGVNLKKLYGTQAMAVFVQPPSLQVLEERLRNRGTDSESAIETRIAKAREELTYAPHFDKVIVNDKLEDSFAQAEKIVTDFYNASL